MERKKKMNREFVDSVITDNNIEANTAFKNSITTKVGDALEIKRKEISRTIANTKVESDDTDV